MVVYSGSHINGLRAKRHIRRHFPPLTVRCRFSPERLLIVEPLITRTKFSQDDRKKPLHVTDLNKIASLEVGGGPPGGGLVPKPGGEVARPGRGGYNLEVVLNWTSPLYVNVRDYINSLVHKHLDTNNYITQQEAAKLEYVRLEALEEFPALARYQKHWVTDDFIRRCLNNTTQKLKGEAVVDDIASAVKRGGRRKMM